MGLQNVLFFSFSSVDHFTLFFKIKNIINANKKKIYGILTVFCTFKRKVFFNEFVSFFILMNNTIFQMLKKNILYSHVYIGIYYKG